jgi:hypothetical protein
MEKRPAHVAFRSPRLTGFKIYYAEMAASRFRGYRFCIPRGRGI